METHGSNASIKWYHYLAALGAGFFLANVMPHMTNGISGRDFPSPFADPPGVGLSSPTMNVIWALINLVLGYVLLRVSKLKFNNTIGMIALFIGIAICTLMCAMSFGSNPNL